MRRRLPLRAPTPPARAAGVVGIAGTGRASGWQIGRLEALRGVLLFHDTGQSERHKTGAHLLRDERDLPRRATDLLRESVGDPQHILGDSRATWRHPAALLAPRLEWRAPNAAPH